MSVDETLLCSFQVRLSLAHCAIKYIQHHTPRIDPEASGEKGEISLWRDEHGTPSDATAQAEEERQQDGLDDNGRRALFAPLFSAIWHFFLSHSPCSYSFVGFLFVDVGVD